MDKFDLDFFEEYTDKLRRSFLRVEKPRNDWRFILITNFTILVIFAAFSFYLFIKISEDDIFISDVENDIVIDTVNRSLLNETVEDFRERRKSFEGIQSKKSKVIDPS